MDSAAVMRSLDDASAIVLPVSTSRDICGRCNKEFDAENNSDVCLMHMVNEKVPGTIRKR